MTDSYKSTIHATEIIVENAVNGILNQSLIKVKPIVDADREAIINARQYARQQYKKVFAIGVQKNDK